jgi:hypothetical protein
MIKDLLVGLVILFAAFASASELTERVKPWDEGVQDASFVKFRNELKEVIAHKDAVALLKLVASDIKIDFGGGHGVAAFRKQWKLPDPKSELWPALSLVVDQGGNFDSKTVFSAPYAYSAFPSDVDPVDKVVVTSADAVLRDIPFATGKVIRKLDHDILTVVGVRHYDLVVSATSYHLQHKAYAELWLLVKDAKGIPGSVWSGDVRSPLDYRALFEKRKGKWLIATFLAGD